MVVEGIRVPAGQADTAEDALRAQGKCNQLVTWDPAGAWVEYCGGKSYFRGLCSEHSWIWFDQDPDR